MYNDVDFDKQTSYAVFEDMLGYIENKKEQNSNKNSKIDEISVLKQLWLLENRLETLYIDLCIEAYQEPEKHALNEISQVNQQYTNLEEFLKIRGITKQESDAVYDLYDTLAELSRLVVGLDIKNSPNSKTDYNTEIANGLKNLGHKVCDFYELYTVAKELNGNDKSLISFKGAAEKLALEKSENIKENEKQM